MKWMQHETKERNSQHAAGIRDKFGNAGYGLFWIIREVIGEQADEVTPQVTYPITYWWQTLNISAKKLRDFLAFCSEHEIFMVEMSGQNITIGDRKLLNLRYDYTRKKAKRNEMSGQCPPRIEEIRKEEKTEELPPTRAVDAAADDAADAVTCAQVVKLYAAILPMLPPVQVVSPMMTYNFRLSLESFPERRKPEFWQALFTKARASPFLMGRRTGKDGRPFQCCLDWLLKMDNIADILNGKYLPDKGEENKHARDAKDYGDGIRLLGANSRVKKN